MSPQQILEQRRGPCFAYLNLALDIVCAEPGFLALCARAGYPLTTGNRLNADLECAVRGLVSGFAKGGTCAMDRSLLLRAFLMDGAGGPHIAVSVEPILRRAPLPRAVERFHLTPRETAVLELILQGLCARDIAVRLHIAHATVNEYFKHLCLKMDAHNRTQMVVRVLDYTV